MRGAARRKHMRGDLARNAHAQAFALHLDLGEVGLVEKLCELSDKVLFAQSVVARLSLWRTILPESRIVLVMLLPSYTFALAPIRDASPWMASA